MLRLLSAVGRLKNAIDLGAGIVHFARAYADVPALIKRRSSLITWANQDREPVYGRHPKAVRGQFDRGYRSTVMIVTALEGIPADLSAIGVNVGMRLCGKDRRKEGQKACK